MISRNIFTDFLMIVLLVALQIFVLNRIAIDGKYTPVVYFIFVIFYPFFRNQYIFLGLSFLLGILIDAFLGTWGINAFSTTLIAYFRTLIFRSSTETSEDFFSFQSLQWSQFLLFIFSETILHQLMVQYLEFFKLSRFFEVLFNVLVTSLVSFVFILVYALVFRVKQKI